MICFERSYANHYKVIFGLLQTSGLIATAHEARYAERFPLLLVLRKVDDQYMFPAGRFDDEFLTPKLVGIKGRVMAP